MLPFEFGIAELMTQGERILFLKGRLDKGFRDHD
jgi:hypothetical protein